MKYKKLKIFVSAYACEPGFGSEIGVGWHWVLEMSKYFDLWVLTRKSNQQNIERSLNNHKTKNQIHFLYYDLPPKLRFWKKGLRGVRTYYFLWQKLTNGLVKRIMKENEIEIYHLLTYGNALWPASSFGQKQFFVWGPIGVGDTIPSDYSKHYKLKGQIIETARRILKKTLPLNISFQNRCRDANLILCKTETALNSIPESFREKAILFTDVAVEQIDTSAYFTGDEKNSHTINYLTVGRLDAWRGFDLLIEAFAEARENNSNIRLEILGEGPDKSRLDALIKKLEIQDYITWGGKVSMETYYKKMAACDVVVNPSLKEGAVTTAFDSMSFGKPLICIDTGGYTRYFSDEYAEIIPCKSRQEVIGQLCKKLVKLTNHDIRMQKGEKARIAGKNFNWKEKGKRINKEIYQYYSEWVNHK